MKISLINMSAPARGTGMFIFRRRLNIADMDIKGKLNEIAAELRSKFGIQVCFCEILGNRWSFFAGDLTLDIPCDKILLNNKYGMITGEITIPEEEWLQEIDNIKKKISLQ